jgi:adenosylcobinamide kinase/adenosylcobinamide-phosphate guanylyltransferase
MTIPPLTLVLGGARSGKSRHAERLVEAMPAPWTYIATAQAFDDEMRTASPSTASAAAPAGARSTLPLDLAGAIGAAPPGGAVLVDCLTLWLTNVMLAEWDVAAEIGGPDPRPAVTGAGTAGPRRQRGRARHRAGQRPRPPLPRRRRPAAPGPCRRADRVVFMVAGLPMQVK